MLSPSESQNRQAQQPLPQQASELATLARRLRQFALAGATPKLLQGKNIGVLRQAQDSEAPLLLLRAAAELGARVATMRWSLSQAIRPDEVQQTSRVLGRLYDAVVCLGMAPDLVREVELAAGIPVYDDIACDEHASMRLVRGLDEELPGADNRRFVLQALLAERLA
ncbi:ornithine carbamoyltransferase [Variovorax sp. OK605]|nr:ornithine carbamoyltransferase [Variovorax sp. OK605]